MQSTVWAINVALGASKQPLIVVLDTGAADTWINSATSELCKSKTGCARLGGAFNAEASTSVGKALAYTYRDGTQVSGDYVRDTLTLAGQTLENFQFAVGVSAKPALGRLGLGYPASQAITSDGTSSYPSIYDILISKGLISTQSFSLWLDSATSGQILFGGVNTARYSGDLGAVPIQQVDGVFKELAIALTRTSLSQNGESVDAPASETDLPANVVLNSGSLFTYLPPAIATNIFEGLRVAGTAKIGGITTAFADCKLVESGITIDYFFGSVKISVPVTAILFAYDVYKQTDKNGNQFCALKIRPASDGKYVLGLSFFESAYIVFDLTKNEISLAPAKKGATENNVIEIGQSPDTPGGGDGTKPNNGGAPDLEGLTLVDPKDYQSLSEGTFIPYEDYIKGEVGPSDSGATENEGNSGPTGSFFEIDPKDFNKIDSSDLITYDEFINSLGGSSDPDQTPTDGGTNENPDQTTDGSDQPTDGSDQPVTPDGGDQGTTPPADQGTAATDGADAGAVTTTTTTVIPAVDNQIIDPVTGLPVDPSVIVGGSADPYADPYYDPYYDPTGGGIFKRVPAPAAARKRKAF